MEVIMFGLYIHFPFCARKCNYCDFLSGPIKNEAIVEEYLEALAQELTIYHSLLKQNRSQKLKSIYLGGGTPSLLEAKQLVQLLKKCRELFDFSSQVEITMEANPGTVDIDKLTELREGGVNRLSFGVQSFDKKLLANMGRIHSPGEAKESVLMAREVGFENISIDLMYGLPEQNLEQWRDTLIQALELGIEHISVYGLKVEAGTPWGDLELQGKLSLPEEKIAVQMRNLANTMLNNAGFKRYEISNYAKRNFHSIHNLGYWTSRPYLGLGLGASSYFWNRRFSNTSDFSHYISLLEKGQLPIKEEEILSFKELMSETIFLGLRLMKGLDLNFFKQRYGVGAEIIYSKEIDKLKDMGLLTIKGEHLQLTTKARPIANYVFTFFV
jgi:oxygen-independent coproporphyrinogen-3 oxidase